MLFPNGISLMSSIQISVANVFFLIAKIDGNAVFLSASLNYLQLMIGNLSASLFSSSHELTDLTWYNNHTLTTSTVNTSSPVFQSVFIQYINHTLLIYSSLCTASLYLVLEHQNICTALYHMASNGQLSLYQ